jgi:hypothetical protein
MGVVTLTIRERRRLELLSRVKEGGLKLVAAAALLELSYRQIKRIWKWYGRDGDSGLAHRGRGRRSSRSKDGALHRVGVHQDVAGPPPDGPLPLPLGAGGLGGRRHRPVRRPLPAARHGREPLRPGTRQTDFAREP